MLLFLAHLINIENLRISFRLFYSLSFFNFIILCSRATSIWYQSITSIRDQVIILCSRAASIWYQNITLIQDQVIILVLHHWVVWKVVASNDK